jgi:hypothetical protein
VSALALDSATLAAYGAVYDAAARALAVKNALADPVTVRVYDGGGQIMGQGTMAAPWCVAAGDTLTIGEVTAFSVLVSGTPDPSTWYLRFESGARWVRGSFGMSASGAAFRWSLASWSAGQLGQIGTATLVCHPSPTAPVWIDTLGDTFTIAPNTSFIYTFTAKDDDGDAIPFSVAAHDSRILVEELTQVGTTRSVRVSSSGLPAAIEPYDVFIDLVPAVMLEGAASAGAAAMANLAAGASTPLAVTLTLAGTGNVPYMATVYPLEGAVPSGQTITSADDANLRGSVLSAWPDGSAQVVVVAGKSNVSGSKAITLRSSTVSDTPLTTAAIAAAVSSISVNFGAGVQTLSDFATSHNGTKGYDWTWWANSQVICARYRLATGLGAIEAVIDIHAFQDGRAFVEVVIENGKVNASAVLTGSSIASQSYTNATVAVNGTTIATVSSPKLGESLDSLNNRRDAQARVVPVGTAWQLTQGNYLWVSTLSRQERGEGTPAVGDQWAVQKGATGTWFTGHDGQIATWNGSAYTFSATAAQGQVAAFAAGHQYAAIIWDTTRGWEYGYGEGHGAARAWYCAAEVNGATVVPKTSADHHALFGLEVTHDTDSLQAHPFGYRTAVASSQNMATKYEQTYDRYAPFQFGRLRVPAMSSGGDDQELTAYPAVQADYIVTGDKIVRRAVLAHGLSLLSMSFNWRHTDGKIPTLTQITGKSYRQGPNTWPIDNAEPSYGATNARQNPVTSHIPFIGVYHFLARPSPCFIDIAHKEFCWQVLGNAVYLNDAAHWESKVLWNGQRAMWYSMRNYLAAWFVTPSSDATRKADISSALYGWTAEMQKFYNKSWNALNFIYGGGSPTPDESAIGSYTQWYQMDYGHQVMRMIKAVGPFTGAQKTVLDTVADETLSGRVSYVNGALAGEWRAVKYYQYGGAVTGANTMDQSPGTWQGLNRLPLGTASASGDGSSTYGTVVPAEKGRWLVAWTGETAWSQMTDWNTPMIGGTYEGDYYAPMYWVALVAGVEQGVPGADAAWTRVVGNSTRGNWDASAGLTYLAQFMSGFGKEPRLNVWPRNKP